MQYEDGKLANIAPLNSKPSFFSGLLSGSTGWGDASIIVPYALYKRYDDVRILEENYDMMKKWYAFLENRAKKKDIKKSAQRKTGRFLLEPRCDLSTKSAKTVDNHASGVSMFSRTWA